MKQAMTKEQRELIVNNRGLAERIAHDFLVKAPGLDIEEVVAVAYQGLVKAAIKFDPSLGYDDKHFGGWARRWINGEILEWQRGEDYLQRYIRTDYKALIAAGYKPGTAYDMNALADATGLTEKRIRTVLMAASADPISTDSIADADTTIRDRTVDVEASVRMATIQGSVAAVVQGLPMLQQVVLALHYFEGIDLKQVAATIGASPSTVKAAHADAVLAIHQEMVRQARDHQ